MEEVTAAVRVFFRCSIEKNGAPVKTKVKGAAFSVCIASSRTSENHRE